MATFSVESQRLAYEVYGDGRRLTVLLHGLLFSQRMHEALPDGRLLNASSLIELRVAPRRLTDEIARFIEACWRPRAAATRARAS